MTNDFNEGDRVRILAEGTDPAEDPVAPLPALIGRLGRIAYCTGDAFPGVTVCFVDVDDEDVPHAIGLSWLELVPLD